jgi:hypothetical protein
MNTTHARRRSLLASCAALAALIIAATGATAVHRGRRRASGWQGEVVY